MHDGLVLAVWTDDLTLPVPKTLMTAKPLSRYCAQALVSVQIDHPVFLVTNKGVRRGHKDGKGLYLRAMDRHKEHTNALTSNS